MVLKKLADEPIYIDMFRIQAPLTKASRDRVSYAVALRAIGQDLSGLLIESLEITVHEGVLHARGVCFGAEKESSREPFERSYTLADINRLDELGSTRQTGLPGTPDASSLAESLRTVGRVVDERSGRLIKLVKHERKITFEYEDGNGELQKQDHYSLSNYKGQQQGMSQRGTKTKEDVWKDSRD
jgi:hypothetical protein